MKAVATLRLQSGRPDSRLEVTQQEDLARLTAAGAALEVLLEDDGGAEADRRQHDIRNTLNALRGYAELLLEEPDKLLPPLRASLEDIVGGVASVCANSAENEARDGAADDALNSRAIGDCPLEAEPGPGSGADDRADSASDALGGRILVVDDSVANRDLLARHLKQAGHQVQCADSGEQALAFLASGQLDLVLLDLIMPGMDGGEVLNRIKANSAWRPIPVIMISGQQDEDGIISCIEAGADDYLFKPFNPVLLQARIKAGLERKRWHDREEQYLAQLERNQQFIRATFGRYVSDEVVQNLLEAPEGLKLGGDLREVTMLMSDIRQFTSICEQLPPDGVMNMLNNYLGKMSEIIIDHQGIIDEIIGDAVFAIFGAPISREDDADRAVQCALDMQEAMRDINRSNLKAGLPEISMGIGINTGTVVAGNIGSEQRSKYGVVGHPVNITARIESRAQGGEVLVSGSTLDKLSTPRPTGPEKQVKMKGIRETVSIYRLKDGDTCQR